MALPIYFLYITISLLFIKEREYQKPNIFVIVAMVATMIWIITFRSIEMPDAEAYIKNFTTPSDFNRFEPGYILLTDVVKVVSSNYQTLFFAVGLIALSLKIKAILTISPYFYGSILVYISTLFVGHEMIQIRAGIASALFLIAVKYIVECNFRCFLITTLLACCFHYSTLILLPLWFVRRIIPPRLVWLCIIPVCYILNILGVALGHLVSTVPIAQIQYLLEMYQKAKDIGAFDDVINIFSIGTLFNVFLLTYFIYFSDTIERRFKGFKVWLMIYTTAMVIFILGTDLAVVTGRLSELLQVVKIIILPLMLYTIKNKPIAKCLLITLGFIELYLIVGRYVVA